MVKIMKGSMGCSVVCCNITWVLTLSVTLTLAVLLSVLQTLKISYMKCERLVVRHGLACLIVGPYGRAFRFLDPAQSPSQESIIE